MKKFLSIAIFIFLGLIAITTNVNAAEVSTLDELKDALEEGGEITLTSDITSSETLSISKDVSIDGNSNKISFTGNIDGFEIETAEKVEISNIKIEAWRGIGISNATFDLTVKDSTITGRQRGITLYSDNNTASELTIENTIIQQAGYEGKYDISCSSDGSTGNYRGISLWELTNSTVNIKNSTIQGFGYNINLTGGNRSFAGTVLNIENSNFKGRTAINSFATDYTVNIKNSNILGINNYSGEQESFADIVLTGTNTKLNIENTKFRNYQDATGLNNPNALQFMLALRGANNTVKISGNTTFIDTTNKLENNFEQVNSSTIEIKGGTYSYEIEKYVAEGYKVYENGDTFVVAKEQVMSEGNGVANEDIEKALEENSEVPGLTEEQKTELLNAMAEGKTITTEVASGEIDAENVNEEDAEKIEEILEENASIAGYYDISVLIKADGEEVGKLSELSEKIKVTIDVPESVEEIAEEYEREYSVIRVHEDKAEALDTEYAEGKVTFETDRFSTYALAYTDTKLAKEEVEIVPENKGQEETQKESAPKAETETKEESTNESEKVSNNPKTGDEVVLAVIALTVSIAGIAIANKYYL